MIFKPCPALTGDVVAAPKRDDIRPEFVGSHQSLECLDAPPITPSGGCRVSSEWDYRGERCVLIVGYIFRGRVQ